jgi:hypothetical protein
MRFGHLCLIIAELRKAFLGRRASPIQTVRARLARSRA